MTEVFEPVDASDRDLALGASGLLARFNAAGVLTAADVHVARAIGAIGGERDDSVLLAAALACRALRAGSVCLDLAAVDRDVAPDLPWPEPDLWLTTVAASPLVAQGVLRWDSGLLYLDRYHEQETQILRDLALRAKTSPPHDPDLMTQSLARVFDEAGYDEQRAACLRAAREWTTVVIGGPGTGKTTAVAGLLVALHDQFAARKEKLRVALVAPTGKAAARLQEALNTARLGPADRALVEGVEAMTIHRLLQRDPGSSTRFRHHRGNRLPHDLVVVDETSMVSLTLMARLLEAVRTDSRLVLVGDPDQLSSVEAGAVLNDVVRGYAERPDSPVVSLTRTHRFGKHIGDLAGAVRAGDADTAMEVLSAGHESVQWLTDARSPRLRAVTVDAALALRDAALRGSVQDALTALERHRLLCAHRDGPHGVRFWNHRVEQWLSAETADPLHDPAYPGRPVLVTANDYTLGVHNGDSGVIVETPGGRRVAMPGSDGPRMFAPARLGDAETMHALTIHKAQGSQAEHVTVLLPDEESRLLTRELFYTAITRAQRVVMVVGEESWIRAAIGRRAQRASGLAVRLGAAAGERGNLAVTRDH